MPLQSTVTISKKGAAQLQRGHLWVFSTDIIDSVATHGEVVTILDRRGRPIGYGFYSQRSKIALRWIAPLQQPVTESLWRERLEKAIQYRQRVVANTDAFRLVFGESDLLPSLIIDRYADHFVLQTSTTGMEMLKSFWVKLLIELFAPRAIIERNDGKVRQLEGLPALSGTLFGEPAAQVIVNLNNLRFQINLLGGQKTGAFLDQRENYQQTQKYAHGDALDCFCYAGGFALHLARYCKTVLGVDVSSASLADAQNNAVLNSIENVEFIEGNVFDYLRYLKTTGKTFDTIVLDPPAFAKSRDTVEGAIRGYKEINLRAMQLLNPGGTLITCSCSYHLSESMFLGLLLSAATDARRSVQILEKRTQAADHPILLSMPETYYLKCLVLRVLP